MKRVLIIDDDEDLIKVLKFAFMKFNFEVFATINGQEALDMARQKKPDIILMDYRLPILDGLEAARRIHREKGLEKVPVIMMTGMSLNLEPDFLKSLNIVEYVTKPFNVNDLAGKIQQHIGIS